MKNFNRVLSWILVITMLAGMCPAWATGLPDTGSLENGLINSLIERQESSSSEATEVDSGTSRSNSNSFAGGQGTESAPYLIETKMQLKLVSDYPSSHFRLTTDIIFTTEDFASGGDYYNNGRGWTPIGTLSSPFTGSFDGDGHSITGLWQKSSASEALGGLFGYIQNATIKNLGMADGNIVASCNTNGNKAYCGIIAAKADNSIIAACWNTGSLKATVSASQTDTYAGGIVGYATGCTIINCYNMGIVYAGGSSVSGIDYDAYTGGIVGQADNSTISNCYNTGTATGDPGDIFSSSWVGGITGYAKSSAVGTSYNAGTLYAYRGNSGKGYKGGIFGHKDSSSTDTDCYYLDACTLGVGQGTDTATKCTESQMTQQSTFVGFDFRICWTMGDGVSYGMPILQDRKLLSHGVPTHPICGTDCNHTPIHETLESAMWCGEEIVSGDYYLGADLDLSDMWVITDNIRLCLNGYTITFAEGTGLIVREGASLELCDCKGTGGIVRGQRVSGSDGSIINNYGSLTIYGGQYCLDGNGVAMWNKGVLTLYGGTFGIPLDNSGKTVIHHTVFDLPEPDYSPYPNAINNDKDAVLTIHDGTFRAHGDTVYNKGTATLLGGTFQGVGNDGLNYYACITNMGLLYIHGGDISSTYYHGIVNDIGYVYSSSGNIQLSGTLYVYGGTISAQAENRAAIRNRTQVTVSGGTISGYIGIDNDSFRVNSSQNGGVCTIYGGTINGTRCGIKNSGVASGDLFSRAILNIYDSPSINSILLEYPDALELQYTGADIINMEIDFDYIKVGDILWKNAVSALSKVHLVNEGYALQNSYDGITIIIEHTWVDATCEAPKTCSKCGATVGNALGHIDSNKDHKCDRNCGKVDVGTHADSATDTDHLCDYGCGAVLNDCADAGGDKDHNCDICGAENISEHSWVDATCAAPKTCSECGATEGEAQSHIDEDKDHTCDYECGKTDIGDHTDSDKNHACDYGCATAIGEHADSDKNHVCDYGCATTIGEHADSTADADHVCDYGCGAVLNDCADTGGDRDHNCDICGAENISEHSWVAATCAAPKTCSECGATEGETVSHNDEDKDHKCDYDCGKTDIGDHADSDKNHACDYGCATAIGEHADSDKSHVCDYGCATTIGEHADSTTDADHVCDYGCGAVLNDCADAGGDRDHSCDICGKENVSEHSWIDASCAAPKTCSECGATDGEKLAHTEEIVPGKAATCTTDGLTEGKKCTICGTVIVEPEIIKAPGHDYDDGVVTKKPTATEKCEMTYNCQREGCGYSYVELLPGGTCGRDLIWYLLPDGTLTISGTGEMDDFAFSADGNGGPWRSYKSVIVKVVIEYGAKNIGDMAFYECSKLTDVTIPNSVADIGEQVFGYCTSLQSLTIPDSVTSIGSFYDCTALTSIDIPDSVTSIGSFYRCTALESIVIPNGVTYVGGFSECTSLTSVVLPDSVTLLGSFRNCTALTSITIPRGVTSLAMHAFYNCSSLTSVTIPDSVTSIGIEAFRDCTSLVSIALPDNLTSVGSGMFYGCTSLTNVTFGNNTSHISDYAFYGCTSLVDIVLPNISPIGTSAFEGCTSLTNITIPNDTAMSMWIANCTIGKDAFRDCTALTSISLPENCTEISESAFYGCTALKTADLGGVQKIGAHAFRNCESLNSVTLSTKLNSVGNYAFKGCSALETVYYNGDQTQWEAISIGSNNEDLTNAERVTAHVHTEETIPGKAATCTEDGLTEGKKCSVCDAVIVAQEVIEAKGHIEETVHGKEATLITPGLTEGKKCSICGSILVEQKEIPTLEFITGKCGEYLTWTLTKDGVLTVSGTGAMYNFKFIVDLLPLSAVAMSEENLEVAPWIDYTTLITKVVIENGVTSIGDNAFAACENLAEVEIPETVTEIGDDVFYGCEALETVTYAGNQEQWDEIKVGEGNEVMDGKVEAKTSTIKKGDVNGDGVVNGRDTIIIATAIANKTTQDFTPEQFAAADVNGDGVVNGRDTITIATAIANKTTDEL